MTAPSKTTSPTARSTRRSFPTSYPLDAFRDGQTLYTLFPSHPLTVSVRKGKVWLVDRQGNRVRLEESFEVGDIIFYPVKTLLRY